MQEETWFPKSCASSSTGWRCMDHGPLHSMYRQLTHKCKKRVGFQKVVLVAAQAGIAWAMGRCMACIGSSITNARRNSNSKKLCYSSTGWHCMGHGPLHGMYRQLNHKCKKKLGFQKVVLVAALAGVAWAMGRCMACISSSITTARRNSVSQKLC